MRSDLVLERLQLDGIRSAKALHIDEVDKAENTLGKWKTGRLIRKMTYSLSVDKAGIFVFSGWPVYLNVTLQARRDDRVEVFKNPLLSPEKVYFCRNSMTN